MAKREAWLDEYTTSNPVTNPTRSTLLEGTWNCIPTRPLAPCPVQTMRFRDRDDTRMWVDDVYMLPLPGALSRIVTLVRRYDASGTGTLDRGEFSLLLHDLETFRAQGEDGVPGAATAATAATAAPPTAPTSFVRQPKPNGAVPPREPPDFTRLHA